MITTAAGRPRTAASHNQPTAMRAAVARKLAVAVPHDPGLAMPQLSMDRLRSYVQFRTGSEIHQRGVPVRIESTSSSQSVSGFELLKRWSTGVPTVLSGASDASRPPATSIPRR